jgi:hypothetical protein
MPNPSVLSRQIPSPPSEEGAPSARETTPLAPWLAVVAEKVKTMRYGVIQIVVHDSKVVQIERTERTRFEVPPGTNGQ